MKTLLSGFMLFISIVIISCLPSCTKETIKTEIKTDTVTVTIRTTDTLRTVFTDNSTLGLITRKQWILDTVLNNYTGPGTGTLVYARGSGSNTYNFDQVRTIYWTGGNQDGYNSIGAYYPYTWKFNGSDSTAFVSSSTTFGAFHAKILKLDATHLTVFDSTNNALDVQIYKP